MEGFAILKENIHSVTQKMKEGTVVELVSKSSKGTYTIKRGCVRISDVEEELLLLFNKDNIVDASTLAKITRKIREKERDQRITSITNRLIRRIAKAIDSNTFFATVVHMDHRINKDQLKEDSETIKSIFTKKGYDVDIRYINRFDDIKAELTVRW